MNKIPISNKIICVIPTFNRIDTLKKCIQAVNGQTKQPDHIIIVDNHSTDATPAWLDGLARSRKDITIVRMEYNCGGAGGYHYGIKKAFQLGASWIWTLDDDAIPEPSALQELLNAAAKEPEAGYLASKVLWKDSTPHVMNIPGYTGDIDQSAKIHPIIHASFVSILVSRRAVEKAGYPIKEFFIHSDDIEYTSRIVSKGFQAFLVVNSRVFHMTPSNSGIKLDFFNIGINEVTKWQYTIRNLVAFNRRRRFGWLREPARLCMIFTRMLLSPTSWQVRICLLKAGIRGLFLQYEEWIEYPENSINTKRNNT
ncbi:MAG: glycosyltransferase family 2 protein [Kiritimatiellae bacterium]|nr:glycosyltransferase family 2 protein [Kiritimatiellia bacterium]MDD5521703.1 glycosyltransferase family 2 protein [Kiritimatiellia bacterium]